MIGVDASQLYPFSMCPKMTTRLYTRWEYDSETDRLKARNNRTRNFDEMVMSYHQDLRPECTIERKHKKTDCFHVDGCSHCKTVIEVMGNYYQFCSCQETRPSLSEQDIERGNKKRGMAEFRREYIKERGYNIQEMW